MTYVANGSVTEIENAAIALSNMKNSEVVLADLASNMCDELLLRSTNLTANLTALSQFALYSHNLITPSIDGTIQFIETSLLQAETEVVSDEKRAICSLLDY